MKLTVPLFVVELSPYSFHIGIEAAVGRKKLRLIIDTGASQTVISSKLVESLKLEKTVPELQNTTVGIGQGELKPEFTLLPVFRIDNVKISNLPCIVLPMDHINSTYKTIGHKSIDGIIGNDLLAALKIRLDMKDMTLLFRVKNTSFDFAKYMQNVLPSRM